MQTRKTVIWIDFHRSCNFYATNSGSLEHVTFLVLRIA